MTNRVLILGATSAIGEAVARHFAAEGDARLYLAARNAEHLETIAEDLRIRGAQQVLTTGFVAEDFATHASLLNDAWSALGGIDVALITHGSLPDQAACEASFEEARRELEVNTLSVISLLTPLANRMAQAGSGTLAVLSSVAGDRGRQSNYLYGCAKGCLNVFLQGLRHRLAQSGVNVLCIKPGFVDTPMTAGFDKGPLWASPETVARDITRAIARGRGTLYTPWFWRWIMLVVRLLPPPLFNRTKL